MADVAIILSSLLTSASCGSTAWSRDSASSLLDLWQKNLAVNASTLKDAPSSVFCHLVLMVKPLAMALSTS